jgi:hypothetical protein
VTVATTSNKISYQGNGATTSFPFGFAFPAGATLAQAANDLVVTFVPASGPSQIIAFGSGPSNYQLSINAPISPNPTAVGGTVIYNPLGTPIPLGSSLVIQRVLPSQQNTSLQNQGTLWQQVIEQALDYLTMLEQQVAATSLQALLAPVTDPAGLNYTIPAVAARANQLLGFDSLGNLVAVPGTGAVALPPGNQTVTGIYTFTNTAGGIVASSTIGQYQSFASNARNTYSGTIASGTGLTAVLSANPTNYVTGSGCCNNDLTLLSSCINITGGGKTQVAQIGSYNASTKTVTITGNVYDNAGNLIGANFSPIPANGYTFTVDRIDYGSFRTNEDRNLLKFEFWNLGATPQLGPFQPSGASPFAISVAPFAINRLTGTINYQYPIAGFGVADMFLSANSPNNSDPFFPATGQPARNLSFFTLQSSGDSGNSGNFPSTFPLTYTYYEALRLIPHQYAGGVVTNNPSLNTNATTLVGLGIGFGRAPNFPLELAGQAALSTGVAVPAGGAQSAGLLLSATASFGVFFGSGAPAFNAAQGSLYLRTDGTTTNNRAYINQNGGAAWTSLTTAA